MSVNAQKTVFRDRAGGKFRTVGMFHPIHGPTVQDMERVRAGDEDIDV